MVSVQITDDAGQTHDPVGDGARILSLVPSLTELLFEMELDEQLIGRTMFCVHPQPSVDAVPSVGGTKRINMEKVISLQPTHAIVNIDENPKQMAEALTALGINVVVTHPIQVTDNRNLFHLFGALFNRVCEAEVLTSRFDNALAELEVNAPPRTALYLIWKRPWMTISQDTYISRFLALGGWKTAAHNPAVRYPAVKLDDHLLRNVDDVLFSTEPFAFTDVHVSDFQAAFPKHAHKAQRIDAEMISWYGSRAINGLIYMKDFATKVRQP